MGVLLRGMLVVGLVFGCWVQGARGSTALDFAAITAEERRKLTAEKTAGSAPKLLEHARVLLERDKHCLPTMPGAFYLPEFVSCAEEERILAAVGQSKEPWQDMGMRRLQRHGGVPCASEGMVPQPFPAALDQVRQAVREGVAGDFAPNFLLLNEYRFGCGISRHKDGDLYQGRVAVLCLASSALLHFWRTKEARDGEEGRSVFLEPRSLLVFEKEAYYDWFHSIEPASSDTVPADAANMHLLSERYPPGAVVPRSTRLSFTFRQVVRVREEERTFATPAAADALRLAGKQFDKAIFDKTPSDGGLAPVPLRHR